MFQAQNHKRVGVASCNHRKVEVLNAILHQSAYYVSDGVMDAGIDTLVASRPTSSVPLRLYMCFKLRITKELGLLAAIVEKLKF